MTIHVLVEGPSELAFLEQWSPRLIKNHRIRIHPHQGKGRLSSGLSARPGTTSRGLLDQLPAKLRAFAASLDLAVDRVVVLVDADEDDKSELVRRIDEAARQAAPYLHVTVSVAVEETEAFYLGDLKGLKKAFPHADMKRAREYVPDSVCGTWELFGRIVGDGGANKVAWGEAMGPFLTTKAKESRSPSFREFVVGMLESVPVKAVKRARRSYHRKAKTRGGSRRTR